MAACGPHVAQKQPQSGPAMKAEKNLEKHVPATTEIPTNNTQPPMQHAVVNMCA